MQPPPRPKLSIVKWLAGNNNQMRDARAYVAEQMYLYQQQVGYPYYHTPEPHPSQQPPPQLEASTPHASGPVATATPQTQEQSAAAANSCNFTPEQDKLLLERKPGDQWQPLLDKIGKTKKECQVRLWEFGVEAAKKEESGNTVEGGGRVNAGPDEKGKTDAGDNKGEIDADDNKAKQKGNQQNNGKGQGQGKQNNGKQNDGKQNNGKQNEGKQNNGKQTDGKQNENKQNEGKQSQEKQQNAGKQKDPKQNAAGRRVVQLIPDNNFSREELQIIVDLVNIEQPDRWFRTASAFYDRTGRRIHFEDIKEKCGCA